MNGQYEEAAKNLEELMNVIEASGYEIVGTCAKGLQGIVITVQGNPSKGLRIVEDVLATYSSQGSKFRCANIHCFLGKVYLQMLQGAGPKDLSFLVKNIGFLVKSIPFAAKKAESHFTKAIDLAKEIRANSILGQAYLDLGLLHKAKKRTEKARECMTKAIEYFELCEAETFLKRAREELQSLR
jgi:tetratricopeptide (TPR) repeat protein